MAICAACGTENPTENSFCKSCGAPLTPQAAEPPAAFTPEIPEPDPLADQSSQPLPPQPAPADPSQPVMPPQPVMPIPSLPRPQKDRSIALVLEIIPGLFGFLGIGWIYSGATTTGIIWLVSVLVWEIIAVIVSIASAGVGCFCTVPVNFVLVGISAYYLNNHIKRHPDLFGN